MILYLDVQYDAYVQVIGKAVAGNSMLFQFSAALYFYLKAGSRRRQLHVPKLSFTYIYSLMVPPTRGREC